MMISHNSTSSFKNSSNALSTNPTTSTIYEPPTTRAGPPQASAQSSTTWQRTPLEVSQPRICYPAPPVQCPVHLPLLSPPVVLPQAQPGPRMPMPSFNLTTVPPPSPLTRPPMPIVRTDNLVKSGSQFGDVVTPCGFCKENEPRNPEIYMSHPLKDSTGRVVCPTLRSFKCPTCGATGDNAHTRSYCPVRNQGGRGRSITSALKSTARMSDGRMRKRGSGN